MQLKTYLPFLCLAACTHLATAGTNPIQILANAPLRFEPTAAGPAKFIARGARYRFELGPDQATLRSGKKSVRLSFAGANGSAHMQGATQLPSTTNLYLGNDPSKWRRAIPNYGTVQVDALYVGIDLTYYGNGGDLEYDLTVNPGADPGRIRLRLDGNNLDRNNKNARLSPDGDLIAGLIQKHPVAYQIAADGSRHSVTSRYRKNADGSYGFQLGAYDRSRALVIDPTLVVSQYIAGSYETVAYAIGHDANGLVYIGGSTQCTDLTLAGKPYQSTEGGDQDLFLAIVNPKLSGSAQVIYSTYIGGDLEETFGAMTVNSSGDVFMTGSTQSSNFPVVNAYQTTLASSSSEANAFVLRFNASQALTYSTYYGGNGPDAGTAITVSPTNGHVWIAGNTQSTNLPVSTGFQNTLIGVQNMFLADFDVLGSGTSSFVYAIYIGGTHWDEAYGIAAAPDGTIWLAAGTYSPDIWIQGDVFQAHYGGNGDGYVAHIGPTLGKNALLYASFLGGSQNDEITSMALDPSGNLLLSGYTLSSDFPVTSTAFQTMYGGNTDAFITVLDTAAKTAKAELVYSTYFGGSEPDAAMALTEDPSGKLYVSGYTESPGLPSTLGALEADYDDSVDAFGLKLDPSKSGAAGIDYFTYLGSDGTQVAYGVDFDSSGDMYLVGYSTSNILSHVGGIARPNNTGDWDAFVIGFPVGSPAPALSVGIGEHHHKHALPRISPHR
jgi:Beta-propeller repeat